MMTIDVLLSSGLREPQSDQVRVAQAVGDPQQVPLIRARCFLLDHPR